MTDVKVKTRCPICDKVTIVTADSEDIRRYESGALIQDAFPTLSASEREMLKTGICPKCWDDMFGEM